MQENFFRENCAGENSEEGKLNVSIKTEEVCIDEHFGHCFRYMLLITNFEFHFFLQLLSNLCYQSDERRTS